MTKFIDFVFNGAPGPEGPTFIEVEDDQRRSIKFGDWSLRDDGYWVLRIPQETEDPEFNAVRALYRKFGFIESGIPTHLTRRKLDERITMLREEVNEFAEAAAGQDLAAMADALVDLDVFLKGTASMMGLPWKALFDDVDRANSAKVRGPTKRGFRDDITKPPGWVGPRTLDILYDHGYIISAYLNSNGEVDEARCLDDPKEDAS